MTPPLIVGDLDERGNFLRITMQDTVITPPATTITTAEAITIQTNSVTSPLLESGDGVAGVEVVSVSGAVSGIEVVAVSIGPPVVDSVAVSVEASVVEGGSVVDSVGSIEIKTNKGS